MTFEERLIDLIKKSGLSHKEIAAKTCIAAGNVSNYRTGKVRPSFEAIIDLANLFHVSTDYLLLGKMDAPPHPLDGVPHLSQWIDLFLSVPAEARPYILLYVSQYIGEAETMRADTASKKRFRSRTTAEHAAANDAENSHTA